MNGGQNSAPLFVLQPELLSQLSQLQKIKKKSFFFPFKKKKNQEGWMEIFQIFKKKKWCHQLQNIFMTLKKKFLEMTKDKRYHFFKLSIPNYGLSIPNFKLSISSFKFQILSFKF